MYKPKFNKVLVEINDKDAKWGGQSEDNLGGVVYREGIVVEAGTIMPTADYPFVTVNHNSTMQEDIDAYAGKQVMWNEGHEAGTVFEEDGKKYALIYWWDIIGVRG